MSAWLDSLSGEFCIGFLVSSAAFNVIFHSIRYQGALTTEKQLAWILTFTTCVVVTTGSLPYVATLIASGFDVSKIVYTDTFSQMLIGLFLAYLFWDLALGLVYYRSTISVLTGYIHHTLYIVIVLYLAAHGVSAIFVLMCYNELPTIVLALGHMRKEWRSDILFALTFFLTRILMHVIMMVKFYRYSEFRFIWKLMLLVLPMHLYWFYGAVRQNLRKYRKTRLGGDSLLSATVDIAYGPTQSLVGGDTGTDALSYHAFGTAQPVIVIPTSES